ncbi:MULTISPECIES: lipopolysaccharide assembly protein LapA domain-containing protein [unclassified Stenotrophomonas]|uniref:lipopolysaccharide assembly protein LapA domain-containing protein n=1 Tax=unclassified Stenotrophomonas TaxID=196198 RepID=UPI0025E64AAD|nr:MULTISPECIES: lipopolysaccharide assembly protein LapA domain-containing protein [unclassified Stenotrophomonas]
MKVFRLLILLAVLVGGLVVGSLNSEPIKISLAFWVLETTSGIAIIASLLLGALVGGGLVMASLVVPMYAKLRRANKAALTATPEPVTPVQTPSPFDGR